MCVSKAGMRKTGDEWGLGAWEQPLTVAGQGLGRAVAGTSSRCPGNRPRRKLAQAGDGTIATQNKMLAYLHPTPTTGSAGGRGHSHKAFGAPGDAVPLTFVSPVPWKPWPS